MPIAENLYPPTVVGPAHPLPLWRFLPTFIRFDRCRKVSTSSRSLCFAGGGAVSLG